MKNKKVLFLTIALSLLTIFLPGCWPQKQIVQSKSVVHKVANLDLLKKEMQQMDKDRLVVFDIDQTLVVAAGHHDNWSNKKAQVIWKPLLDKLSLYMKATGDIGLWKKLILSPKRLLDPTVLSIIDDMKQKSAKIIALTAAVTGSVGSIRRFEDHRFNDLKSLDVDFSDTVRAYPDITITELSHLKDSPMAQKNKNFLKHPVFYKGILLTAKYEKGEVLKAFLDKINWWPKKIIFIDDHLKYLKDVQRVAKDKGVDFVGLYYRAAEKAHIDIDPKVAAFQIYYLIEHKKWVSAQKAKKLMKDMVITWESIVEKYDLPIIKKRVAISVDPNIYDAYVGEYQIGPDLMQTITRKGNRLFAQITDDPPYELFSESETKFFFKDFDVQISFIKNKGDKIAGLIRHRGGRSASAKKIQ